MNTPRMVSAISSPTIRTLRMVGELISTTIGAEKGIQPCTILPNMVCIRPTPICNTHWGWGGDIPHNVSLVSNLQSSCAHVHTNGPLQFPGWNHLHQPPMLCWCTGHDVICCGHCDAWSSTRRPKTYEHYNHATINNNSELIWIEMQFSKLCIWQKWHYILQNISIHIISMIYIKLQRGMYRKPKGHHAMLRTYQEICQHCYRVVNNHKSVYIYIYTSHVSIMSVSTQ
jgi:hypothetical protein